MFTRSLVVSIFILLFTGLSAQEFSQGPYGTWFNDIAGPFFLPDLNAVINGDVNEDEIVNVQDIILVVNGILEMIELTDHQFDIADINNDGILDILDIVTFVNLILYPQPPGWDFESNWNGDESYIFIHKSNTVPSSEALWYSDTKEAFLNNSPLNVHYFFISDNFTYQAEVQNLSDGFDEVLAGFTPELEEHWHSHLHFIPEKSTDLENWLGETLQGKYAFGIDRFQKIRQVGYLGNPNGFTGTYLSYIAHEAVYYNHLYEKFSQVDPEMMEIALFDSVVYNGGWSPTLTANIVLPDNEELSSYTRMEVEADMPCAGYDDDNCDDYDRTSRLRVCDPDGSNCMEITRWITPFDRQPHYLTDITSYIAALRPGGEKQFKFTISGWPNAVVTLKLRFYNDGTAMDSPHEIIPCWNQTRGFNENYNNNFEPVILSIPENATRVELASYITGHGMACDVGNCAEFCNSGHLFEVNGGMGNFQKTHPEAGLLADCMSLESIAGGVIPNQWGTWGYGRAGWCPGLEVEPFIYDMTEMIVPGDDNVITYEGCFIQNESQGCTGWPPLIDCGGGYAAEIIMSSYVIIWY